MDEGHYRRIPQCRARRRKSLIAFGINKGDAVTIFSTTRYEWGVLDFALAAIGAVNVPIYDTDSAAQAERILNDSDVKLAIADNRERFDRLDSVIDRCPSLKHILMLDSNAMGALEGLGVTVSDEELEARIDSVHADDLATIVYTSGSTGAPKGAELSHRNFISITRAGSLALHEIVLEDHPRLLLFLPLAHCFARFIQYARLLPTTAWLVICRTQRRCCPICVPSNRPICWAYHECSRRCITRPPARPARVGRDACSSSCRSRTRLVAHAAGRRTPDRQADRAASFV